MNTFVEAVKNQEARTENGMKALDSTTDAVVDLFYAIGASRGKNIVPQFTAAWVADSELALRVALWSRDVRGGAGERELFRSILRHLEVVDADRLIQLLPRVTEVGRWDDLLIFTNPAVKRVAYDLIAAALRGGNALAAKWMPREKSNNADNKRIARELARHMGLDSRAYRKLLSGTTTVVETEMCAKQWDQINFNQVPSLAGIRYRKAFDRNTPLYKQWVEALARGDVDVKVNAGAVYPYDVIGSVFNSGRTATEVKHMIAQWDALPNYVGSANILPMVDVSGSMTCAAGGRGSITCLDVAVSLGLYLADKNTGAFKDTFLTFTSESNLVTLRGNIYEKMSQMRTSEWEMGTNLHNAMDTILRTAKRGNVLPEDMPKMLLILSDMQFDACVHWDDSAIEMIERKFNEAGYQLPKIVFWNINHGGNQPVRANDRDVALVSGFSPAITKALLEADMSNFTPRAIMMRTIMIDRYDPVA